MVPFPPYLAGFLVSNLFVGNGKDCVNGGAKYNSFGVPGSGSATIAENLLAIKYLCYDAKKCTPRSMYDAVMANWAGPETGDAGADPPLIEGRPKTMEEYERISSIGPAGVLATACRQRGSDATRETPAVIAMRVNWQLARDRPGRMGWRRGPYYR